MTFDLLIFYPCYVQSFCRGDRIILGRKLFFEPIFKQFGRSIYKKGAAEQENKKPYTAEGWNFSYGRFQIYFEFTLKRKKYKFLGGLYFFDLCSIAKK